MSPRISRSAFAILVLITAAGAPIPGPVSHWAAEGDTLDVHGAHDGVANGPVGYRAGGVGQGFDLNGSAWISVPSWTGGAGLGSRGLTVALWVQEDQGGGAGSWVNLRHGGNNSGFTLENVHGTPGRFAWLVNNGTGGGVSSYDGFDNLPGCPVGTRFHIAGTFDPVAQRISVYRNGRLVQTKATSSANPMVLAGDEVFLMGRNAIIATTHDGMLDEIRIYDRALTEAEVQSLIPGGPFCIADLVCSGSVNGQDLAVLLGQWTGATTYSPCPPHAGADLNNDCRVNGLDLAMLLSAWGACP